MFSGHTSHYISLQLAYALVVILMTAGCSCLHTSFSVTFCERAKRTAVEWGLISNQIISCIHTTYSGVSIPITFCLIEIGQDLVELFENASVVVRLFNHIVGEDFRHIEHHTSVRTILSNVQHFRIRSATACSLLCIRKLFWQHCLDSDTHINIIFPNGPTVFCLTSHICSAYWS